MSSSQQGITSLPNWGVYSRSYIGLYNILDTLNSYAINHFISIKISTNAYRFTGKYTNDNGSTPVDTFWAVEAFDPNYTYWRYNFDLAKFGSTGSILVEVFKYTNDTYGVCITVKNNSSSAFDIEFNILGTADALLVSYNGSTLVQNYIYSAGLNYVGATWSTQTTKATIVGSDLTITPQDIQDSSPVSGFGQANPYVGNGLGRTFRGAISWTCAAKSQTNHVMGVSIGSSENVAAANIAGFLTNYTPALITARSNYLINRSRLITENANGALLEKVLGEMLHMIKYVNFNSKVPWLLGVMPGINYSTLFTIYFTWDAATVCLGLAEAGYTTLAKDIVNYFFGTDGTYVNNVIHPPIWTYVIWRIYQITNDVTFLNSYYAAVKAKHTWMKTNRAVSGYMRWNFTNESGMDNCPCFPNPVDGAANTYYTPDFTAYQMWSASILSQMASVLNQKIDVATFQAEINALSSKLETMWDNAANYYWPINPSGSTLVKVKTISSMLTILAPNLSTSRVNALANAYLTDFSVNGNVASVSPNDATYGNSYWNGPSWVVTDWLISLGFRQYGRIDIAQKIEKSMLLYFNDLNSKAFREYKISGNSFGGTAHFSSFMAALIIIARNISSLSMANFPNKITEKF